MWRTRCVVTERGSFEMFAYGEGPPLCVAHLYSEFNDSGDLFAERFAAHRTVHLVNLRGAGNSPPPRQPEDLSISAAAKDLEAVRKALGCRQWDFAGHSTGDMLGLHYAVTYGHALRSLIVVGAAASRHYADTPHCIYHRDHPRFRHMQDLIQALKADDLTKADRRRFSEERRRLSLHRPERYADYFRPDVTKRISAPRLDHFGQKDFPTYDLRDRLRDCHVRTLVLCGRHDVQCPVESSEKIAALMPQAELVVFEASNHYPFLEEGRAFDDAVGRFLQPA